METFKTLDYEAEARKIADAFGLPPGCEFTESRVRVLTEPMTVQTYFDMGDGWAFQCKYSHWGRDFTLSNGRLTDGPNIPCDIFRVDWKNLCTGPVEVGRFHEQSKLILAKGFYFMGESLETINTIFLLSVSCHELLEWELERDERQLATNQTTEEVKP